ncbi:MAG TPA: YciI family protein [Gemmatimonadaceae bacterium]|nr:YciI family protein [Gemmatimonadaceae bacterium]
MDTLGLERRSTDGGRVQAYCDGDSLRLLVADYYGEIGDATERFYFANDSLLFVLVESRRGRPNGQPYPTRTLVEHERFYFSNDRLIRWLGNRNVPHTVTSTEARERATDLLTDARDFKAVMPACRPKYAPNTTTPSSHRDSAAYSFSNVVSILDGLVRRVSVAATARQPTRNRVQERTMRFILMGIATKESEGGEPPTPEAFAAMQQYNEELAREGILLAAEGLAPTSKSARVKFSGDERTVIDGPFAEAKEVVAGFSIIRADSLEEAIQVVKRTPNIFPNGKAEVEIRKLMDIEDFGDGFTPNAEIAKVKFK